MSLDITRLVVLKAPKEIHLKKSKATCLSRNHELVAQDNAQFYVESIFFQILKQPRKAHSHDSAG